MVQIWKAICYLVVGTFYVPETEEGFWPHTKVAFFFVSSWKLSPSSAKQEEYLFRKFHTWKILQVPYVGGLWDLVNCLDIIIFRFVPSEVDVVPKKCDCLVLNCSLTRLSFKLCCLVACTNLVWCSSWSLSSLCLSHMIILSAIPVH